ncbi:MAG: bifunctional metallophosphatase/5'-nucleotidase [Chloroflexi bacterium]|nr:bifunctional metallophosphatase/5'-nucleotidase [Chloroflexota bacterium]
MYLFEGDATKGPILQISSAEGVRIPESELPLPQPARLKILHFNDLHGHLACFTSEDTLPVFSRMVARIHAIRKRHDQDDRTAVMAITAGDEIGGAIFDELLGECCDSYQLHPSYRLYSQAGVDLGVPGNHDLDKGTAILAHAIKHDAAFPILAANITGRSQLSAQCYPAALFVSKGLRIGFIGLTTPAQVHPELTHELQITDPVEAAQNLIPAIRPLCDILIIVSHLGYDLEQQSASVMIAGDVELARSLSADDVHLIIGGHTHNVLNEKGLSARNIVNGIPIVQAGKMGQFIGEVDITAQEVAAVTYVRLTATADLPVDEVFESEYVKPLVDLARPYWDRSLGRVAEIEDLGTDNMRNEFAAGESALANFIADALVSQCRQKGIDVDFAMIDASNVRGGLDIGGDVTFGDWFNLMPFADTLTLYRMTGEQLQALLQDNASRIDRPNRPHTERGFLHFSKQIRYHIDLGFSYVQARVVDISVMGQSIETVLNRSYLVASTSFLRGPAKSWETYAYSSVTQHCVDVRQLPQEYTNLFIRDLLVNHIVAHGGVLAEGGVIRDGRLRIHTSSMAIL